MLLTDLPNEILLNIIMKCNLEIDECGCNEEIEDYCGNKNYIFKISLLNKKMYLLYNTHKDYIYKRKLAIEYPFFNTFFSLL